MQTAQGHSIPGWSDEARAFHDILCQARRSTSASTPDILHHQLQIHRDRLIALLDDSPKSSQDRTTLESGKTYINGVTHKVNDVFIKEAVFLSDQLNVNEHVAATLLMTGMVQAARLNSNAIDTAIILYHDERGYLLACWNVILQSAKDGSVRDDVRAVFYQFVADIMQQKIPLDSSTNNSLGTFPAKLLKAAKSLRDDVVSLEQSGRLPSAPQPPPQQQQQQQLLQQQQPTLAATNPDSGPVSGRLGEDITKERIERLTDERIYVFQILYHAASLVWLEPNDIIAINQQLETMDLQDTAMSYLLLALLGALSLDDHLDSGCLDNPLIQDTNFSKKFHQQLATQAWRVPAAKGVALLQWVMFATQSAALDPTIIAKLPAKREDTIPLIDRAIEAKAFDFMNEYLLYFQQPKFNIETERTLVKRSADERYTTGDTTIVDMTDFTRLNADIRPDFREFVVHALEQLTDVLIESAQRTLQNIKYREEDISASSVGAAAAAASFNSSTSAIVPDNETTRCRDLEAFFLLLASIYRGRTEKGAKFWTRQGNHLHAFVKWTMDIKVAGTTRACYDFFASLATGVECATHAYHFFERNSNRSDFNNSPLFAWSKLFSAMHFFAPLMQNEPKALPSGEEDLLVSFLGLLQQVVQYSPVARAALWEDTQYQTSKSIIDMIGCRTTLTLRAALYNTLAAFCSPWGGGAELGRKISARIWDVLENSDILLSKRDTPERTAAAAATTAEQPSAGMGPSASSPPRRREPLRAPKFLQELTMERALKVYDETRSVLNLIGSAIHTQTRREDIISGFMPTLSTIPYDLGKGTRSPGASPYISLVIDHIFVELDKQDYLYPGSKWQLAAACLKVFENSVLSFDIHPLQEFLKHGSKGSGGRVTHNTLAVQGRESNTCEPLDSLLLIYLAHPGFEVILRLLAGRGLLQELLKIVERGPEGIRGRKETTAYFAESVMRSLRILDKVLAVQDVFCNVLIPLMQTQARRLPTAEWVLGDTVFAPLPSLAPLGQLMLYHANSLVQLSLLVNCVDQDEICYLSTRILEALSREPNETRLVKDPSRTHVPMGGIGTRLAGVLRNCKDENAILHAFSERLDIDTLEITTPEDYEYDINNIPFWFAAKTISDVYGLDAQDMPRMESSVRLALIDLLLKNSALDKPAPTLSDFLLGYSDPRPGYGHGHGGALVGMRPNETARICFRSILSLLSRGVTGDANTDEELPLVATHPVLAEKCYKLIYQLCAKESTSDITMRYLRSKEDFFYHQFRALSPSIESYPQVAEPIIPGTVCCADDTQFTMDFIALRAQLHQRAWMLKTIALELHVLAASQSKSDIRKLLSLLYGYNEAEDEAASGKMEVDSAERNIFSLGGNRFQQPLTKVRELINSLEFKWVDAMAIDHGPLLYFDGFYAEPFKVPGQYGCDVYDIRSIYCVLRNDEKAKQDAGIAVSDAERAKLEDEMGRILTALMAANHHREIAHGKHQCLRAWKQVVQVTLTECFGLFSFEVRERITLDLLSTVLPKMIHGENSGDTQIMKGFSEVVTALMTHLREDTIRQQVLESAETSRLPDDELRAIFQGILECIQQPTSNTPVRGDLYTALIHFLHYVDRGDGQCAPVERQFVETLGESEALLDRVCTDATDGEHVWKSTAYVVLESLHMLSVKAKSSVVLSYMIKKNFLKYSIDMMQRENIELLNLLEQREASMTPLYIYEAKMSLYLRLALTREGAKRLFENRIVDALEHCQFINARPENSLMQLDNEPSSTADLVKRYEQMLLPTLKLIVALVTKGGNRFLTEKVERWARKQQDCLLYILKDETVPVTLSSLEQLKLASTIMYHLSCREGFFKDLASRGLHQLHTSMTQLIAKYLIPHNLEIVPQNDEDRELSVKLVFGGSQTIFESQCDTLLQSIQLNLTSYAQNAAFAQDEQGPSAFRPMFSNTLSPISDDNGLFKRNVSVRTPSLSTLVACMRDTLKKLQGAVAEYEMLRSQKGDITTLRFEEVREVFETAFKTLKVQFENLSPSQQRQILTSEFRRRADEKAKQMRHLLDIVDMVMLVLLRHLEFYLQPSGAREPFSLYPSYDHTTESPLFQSSLAIASSLKKSLASHLDPVLQILDSVFSGSPELRASGHFAKRVGDRIGDLVKTM